MRKQTSIFVRPNMKLSLPKKVQSMRSSCGRDPEREEADPDGGETAPDSELVACGVRRIEVSSFVNRSLVPQMADAEALWERIERKRSVLYSALILSSGGSRGQSAAGFPMWNLCVASETHSLKNSNKSVSEALKRPSGLSASHRTPDEGPGRRHERLRLRL